MCMKPCSGVLLNAALEEAVVNSRGSPEGLVLGSSGICNSGGLSQDPGIWAVYLSRRPSFSVFDFCDHKQPVQWEVGDISLVAYGISTVLL